MTYFHEGPWAYENGHYAGQPPQQRVVTPELCEVFFVPEFTVDAVQDDLG